MSQLIKLETAPDLVEQVYRALLDAISDGSLAPGTRITQEEIAAQLSVSRQPVLQALRLLKKDGFVLDAVPSTGASTRGRGLLVSPIDATWIANVYEVRSALDALAARLCCASNHEFNRNLFDKLIAQGRNAAAGKNIKAMIEADMAFHNAIYAASGNPLIEQSAHLHWRHIRRAMGAVLQASAVRESVWDEHQAIANAIATGDAQCAEKLMSRHGHQAATYLAHKLADQRLLQNAI